MANPEELRKQDQKLPKPQRKYPQSRVTQVMWVLIAVSYTHLTLPTKRIV